jgi:HPt (histidine-containing phosphotransfer) domain-containing protein
MMAAQQNRARAMSESCEPKDRPIDLVHLSRMTFGDRSLEREVLQLFERQAAMLMARMTAGNAADAARLAHTINGSARGIGAWRVAAAAASVEAVSGGDGSAQNASIAELGAAVEQARTIIGELLRAH